MHEWLAERDHHRIHAPVGGEVVEARIMSGQHYAPIETMGLGTEAKGSESSSIDGKKKKLLKRRVFNTPNGPIPNFYDSISQRIPGLSCKN